MSSPSTDNPLSRLLRQTDPLIDDPGLAPSEAAEMRRTILTRSPRKAPRLWPQLTPALSVAALLALALGAAWWPMASHAPQPIPVPARETPLTLPTPTAGTEVSGGGNALENRRIQFETPGGTLVVWVLNPNFPS